MAQNSILSLSVEERPRERLIAYGAKNLSCEDLLAIILGSGSAKYEVRKLAKQVLAVIDSHKHTTAEDLKKIKGIGQAKATLIAAALEFSRRRIAPQGVTVKQASDVIPLVNHLAHHKQEHFCCISLNGAHEVIACRTVTVGLVNCCQVHPREVFSDPLTDRAVAVMLLHNHPSGSLTPSQADTDLTSRMIKAGEVLGIKVLDHIIFSARGHLSFQESGLMN